MNVIEPAEGQCWECPIGPDGIACVPATCRTCQAVNPETGRRCTLRWPHDGMHRVLDGRWFA